MNIQQAIDTALSEISRSQNTKKTYRNAMNTFVTFLTETRQLGYDSPAQEITVKDFIGFPGWLASIDGYTKSSKELQIAGAKVLYEWLVENDYLSPTEQDRLRIAKAKRKVSALHEDIKVKTPAVDIVEDMLRGVEKLDNPSPAKERDKALVLFLYSTGRRVGALLTLKVEDFSADGHVTTLEKGRKSHLTRVSDRALEAIHTYWLARGWADPDDPAFARHDRTAGKQHLFFTTTVPIGNIIDRVEKAAGLDQGMFDPHDFRRAFVTRVGHEAGIRVAQEAAGHANISTTQRYFQLSQNEVDDTLEKLFE